MHSKTQKAFTMIELVYVIVIIGILSAIAIPKFQSVSEEAYMSKGKNTLAIVRSAVATERQKQILQGIFTPISITNAAGRVFTSFTTSGRSILDSDLPSCTDLGCWSVATGVYTFYTDGGGTCTYAIDANNRFSDTTVGGCTTLEDN